MNGVRSARRPDGACRSRSTLSVLSAAKQQARREHRENSTLFGLGQPEWNATVNCADQSHAPSRYRFSPSCPQRMLIPRIAPLNRCPLSSAGKTNVQDQIDYLSKGGGGGGEARSARKKFRHPLLQQRAQSVGRSARFIAWHYSYQRPPRDQLAVASLSPPPKIP